MQLCINYRVLNKVTVKNRQCLLGRHRTITSIHEVVETDPKGNEQQQAFHSHGMPLHIKDSAFVRWSR